MWVNYIRHHVVDHTNVIKYCVTHIKLAQGAILESVSTSYSHTTALIDRNKQLPHVVQFGKPVKILLKPGSPNVNSNTTGNVIPNPKLRSTQTAIFDLVGQWATYFLSLKSTWRQNRKYLLSSLLQKIEKVVPNLKWGNKVSCMYATSADSGQHHRLLNIQDGGPAITGSLHNLAICPNIIVVPNPNQAYS